MKILYVVSRPIEINTSASIRNKATIQGLLSCGASVDLITTEPDKNHFAYDDNLKIQGINVKYIRLGGRENIARVSRKFGLLLPLKRKLSKMISRNSIYDGLVSITKHIDEVDSNLGMYDFIISSSDPKSSHLFVFELLKKNKNFKGRWIQIWGDPFASDITIDSKKTKQMVDEEDKLLSRADRIVYVSALTKKKQQEMYPRNAYKMVFQPIPYYEKKIYDIKKLNKNEKLELAYCGDYLSKVRNIMPLYNAITSMEDVHLTICGLSDIKLKNTENVTVLPRVSHAKVEEIEMKSDLLIHLSNSKGTQIPGKIYQYSGTNKPILFILDGDIDELYDCFKVYDRYIFSVNIESDIKETIETFHNEDVVSFCPIEEFDSKKIAEKIISF